MNLKEAQDKAAHLSAKYSTVAVAYKRIVYPYNAYQYDACLQEVYTGDEEDIETVFASGKALDSDEGLPLTEI